MSAKPKPEKRGKKPPKPIRRSKLQTRPENAKKQPLRGEYKSLVTELDRLCSRYIILRDMRCVTCGTRSELTCSHFIKRACMFFRFDIYFNLHCQCATCNNMHNTNRLWYTRYMKSIFAGGDAMMQAAEQVGREMMDKAFSWTVPELREKVVELKELLGEI